MSVFTPGHVGLIRPGGARVPRWQQRHEDQQAALLDELLTEGRHKAPPPRQTVGDFTGLCLLVDFPDRPATIPRDVVDAYCNQPGFAGFGNRGSVADYFAAASRGRLRYRTLVLPYVTAPQPFGFYDAGGVPWPERTQQLIQEVLAAHKAQGVDFSGLTADDAQAVYAMNVFHAGPQAAVPRQGLWPHAWRLDRPVPLAPGRTAVDYQVSAMGDALTLGVYCHENGHMLCEFPDLYALADNARGVGRYCLMCLGCNADPRNPTLPGAYLRWHAGWADAQVLAPGPQRLAPAPDGPLLLHRRSATEYLLIEHRRAEGRDAALHGSGLAVWHVDELGSNFSPEQAPPGHQHAECRLLQADGLRELDEGADDGDGADLFAPPRPAPFFTEGTALAPRWHDGTPTGLQLHSLRAEGDALVFVAELG